MPIRIQEDLPACSILENENIFVMTEYRALHQDIRPLHVLIMNLMPTKIITETQLLRKLSNTPLQVQVEFLQTSSYIPQHIDSTQIQALAVSLFPSVLDGLSGATSRAAPSPSSSSVSRFLDLVADTPHSLEIDTNNRISAIDLHVPVNTPSSTQTAPNDPEDLLGISDVTIQELDILSSDPNAQLFMLSEQQRYQNFKIGTKKISINCRYPWWFVANTLENSVLGNASNVQINKGQAKGAKVRIGDGKDSSRYCIKPSSCSTDQVVLVGLGKIGHAVPSNVSIT